jgi:hypothetical protein
MKHSFDLTIEVRSTDGTAAKPSRTFFPFGIGFINPSNLTRIMAYPAPDALPDTGLAMELLKWNPFLSKTPAASAA